MKYLNLFLRLFVIFDRISYRNRLNKHRYGKKI